MTPRTVRVTAPSRLHFGMLSFGHPNERQFGGIGAMIDKPGLQLRISHATSFEVQGPLAERAQAIARHVFEQLQISPPFALNIELLQAPSEHVGLGVGTQLGLSIAAGLNAFVGRAPLKPATLAALAGRGERSAIGTYGFIHGGLLVEAGKLADEALSPLTTRTALPEAWRFVLILPQAEQGRHGVDERQAFRELPPVSRKTTAELGQIATEKLVPAASESQFEDFAENLYQYGRLAGLCFSKFQHGPFATERLHLLVERIREMGIRGVGQTSWGPTIFALTADETSAQKLVESLRVVPEADGSDFIIAAPHNRGARIETE